MSPDAHFYRFGLLIGKDNPSLSPLIHQYLFSKAQIEGSYKIFNINDEQILEFLRGELWDGLNITTPYKTKIFQLCDKISDRARRTGAVNTVMFRDGLLWGDNTDVPGIQYALRRERRDHEQHFSSVAIIGTGGVARAAMVAIREMTQNGTITILTRDIRAARTRLSVLDQFPARVILHLINTPRPQTAPYDLLIIAQDSGEIAYELFPIADLANDAFVLDLTYWPWENAITRLIRNQRPHSQYYSGLVVLIAQAVKSFNIWTNKSVRVDDVVNSMLPDLQRHDPLSNSW